MDKNYKILKESFQEYITLNNISAILSWDSSAMMPEQGFEQRKTQISLLHNKKHELLTKNEYLKIIDDIDIEKLNEAEKGNLQNIKHILNHYLSVPEKLKQTFLNNGLECEFVWRKARKENDYNKFAEYFQKVLDNVIQIAEIKSEKLGLSKYDALLDYFDPGTKEIDFINIFEKLESTLPNLITSHLNKTNDIIDLSHLNFPIEIQKSLTKFFSEKLGLNYKGARLDESLHPFCGGYTNDVRITTRYEKDNFLNALMGVIHETGHAIYESNLPQDHLFDPVGQALGMSIHESQSLFYEMQIARSRDFINYATPIIKEKFSITDTNFTSDNLYHYFNKVEKSLIRVDADELTYPLHVIMRYKLEKQLINKELSVRELPEAWNNYIKQYFDINVPDYAHGCMQDIHWTDGTFGYFPCYTLGAIIASQFKNKLDKDISNNSNLIQKGDFTHLNNFLKNNLHKFGSIYSAKEILQKNFNEAINVDCYLDYLKNKF